MWDLKRPVLEALWIDFQQQGSQREFVAFRRQGGEPLEAHATFEALSSTSARKADGGSAIGPRAFAVRALGMSKVVSREPCGAGGLPRLAAMARRPPAHGRCGLSAPPECRSAFIAISLSERMPVDRKSGPIRTVSRQVSPWIAARSVRPAGPELGLPPFNPLTLEEQLAHGRS